MRASRPARPALPNPPPPVALFRAGKRTMPVRELHAGADPDELTRGITAAHPALLGPQAVSHQQARLPRSCLARVAALFMVDPVLATALHVCLMASIFLFPNFFSSSILAYFIAYFQTLEIQA